MQTATMPTAAGLWMVLIPVAGQGASSSQPFSSSPPRTACAATGDTRGAASVGQDPCHADHAGASLRSSSPVLPSRCATDHSTVSSNDRGWCQRQSILNRWLIWRGTHTDEHNQSAANFLLRVSFLFCVFNVRWIFFVLSSTYIAEVCRLRLASAATPDSALSMASCTHSLRCHMATWLRKCAGSTGMMSGPLAGPIPWPFCQSPSTRCMKQSFALGCTLGAAAAAVSCTWQCTRGHLPTARTPSNESLELHHPMEPSATAPCQLLWCVDEVTSRHPSTEQVDSLILLNEMLKCVHQSRVHGLPRSTMRWLYRCLHSLRRQSPVSTPQGHAPIAASLCL